MAWSADGTKLAYSKYHFGENQSQIYDIKVYDTKTKKHFWLTKSLRATYPIWLDSNTVSYVAHHNNISNIFTSGVIENEPRNLTGFTDNTQIAFLSISPDSGSIAVSMNP